MRRILFSLLSVTLATCVGCIALEVGLRSRLTLLGFERLAYLPEPLKQRLGPRFIDAYRATGQTYLRAHARDPALEQTVPDERYAILLGARGAPSPAVPARPFAVDALGFRNPAVPAQADLLFVGDSFTTGVAFAADLIFTTRVARTLNRRGYQAAAGGWGPRQYHAAVTELVPRLRAKWVIIATYIDNDPGDVWAYDGWKASHFETYAEFLMYRGLTLRVNPRVHGLDARSVLANLVRFRLGDSAPQRVELPHIQPADAVQYRDVPLAPMDEIPPSGTSPLAEAQLVAETPGQSLVVRFATERGVREVRLRWKPEDTRTSARKLLQVPWWPPYAEAMRHTITVAQAGGARVLIVLVPSRERVLAPAVAASGLRTAWPYGAGVVPDGYGRVMASFTATVGAEYLDLAPALRAQLAEGTFGYMDGNIHFNAAGHALAADAIAAYIREVESAPAS